MNISVTDYCIIGYLILAIITGAIAYSKLRDPWYYRLVLSCIVGAFWPIPAALFVFLYMEGVVIDIANWITRKT